MPRLTGDAARIQRLIDRLEPRVRDAFLEAIQNARDAVDLAALEAALRAGDVARAAELASVSRAFLFPLDEAIVSSYAAGGRMIAEGIPVRAGRLGFDGRSPRAEQWAREQVGGLIQEVVEDQRKMARQVVERQLVAGRNPRTAALDIAGRVNRATGRREGGFIGLTENQSQYVDDAREQLRRAHIPRRRELNPETGRMRFVEDDPVDQYMQRELRDKRFDRTVRRAVDEGRPLNASEIDRITNRYKDRLLRHRAEVIARTESINALRAGRREGIQQAVDQGIIRQDRTRRTWDATLDSNTRPDHAAQDGVAVEGMDAPHVLRDGSMLMYPGDSSLGAPASQTVQCRCFERFRVDYTRA